MAIADAIPFVAKYAILLLVPCGVILFLYRACFHPLAKYPGPRWASLSDSYAAWYAFRRVLPHQTYRDHVKYGPVIRQGPDKLVFNSVTAVKDIYLGDNVLKSRLYHAGNFTPGAFNIFNAVDKNVHRAKRKLVGPVVTERSMRTFEPQMATQIDVFLRKLLETCQNNPAAVINMTDRCKWLAMDIVGDLAFGYDLKLQTEETNRFLPPALMLVNWRMNCYIQFPFLRSLRLEPLFNAIAVHSGHDYFKKLLDMIQARVAIGAKAKHDLYSFLVDAVDDHTGRKLELGDIFSESITFVAAGGETTSTSICATLYYLALNPSCKAKVVAEIDAAFDSASEIHSGPKLTSCSFLRACLDEAIRLSPPAGGTLWREQSPETTDKAFIVDGHVIPPGTQVGVNIYSIHHNEEYFPEPFSYKPERWLSAKDGSDNAVGANKAAFVPFSIGTRSCIGRSMGYMEASLVLAKLLWFFDLEAAGETASADGEFQMLDIFSALHTGPFLKFTPRGDRWRELVGDEE